MKTYQVRAKRWERGWELHIDGVGVTQTRSLAKAEQDVADYLDMLVGDEAREVVVIPELDAGLDRKIREARDALTRAVDLQRVAAEKSRDVVRSLADKGLPGAEIAAVLKVSPQRVSQLVAEAGHRKPGGAKSASVAAKSAGRKVAAKRSSGVASRTAASGARRTAQKQTAAKSARSVGSSHSTKTKRG